MKILRTITTLMLLISFIFLIYACSGKTPRDPVIPDPPPEPPVSPDPPQVISVSPSEGVEYSPITFTAETTGGDVTDWLWDFGDAASPATSTESQPTVTLGSKGNYDCSVTVNNEHGEDSFSFTLTITASEPINNRLVWDDTVGIQSAEPGDGSITVTFGTATSPWGDDVIYSLHYIDETFSGNSDPFRGGTSKQEWDITSPYTLTGLYNGHKYWLGVRAFARKADGFTFENCGNIIKLSAIPEGECSPGPVIITTELPEVIVGVPYDAIVMADRGHGKMAWYLDEGSVLPAGIKFRSGSIHADIGCTFSGIPEEYGDFPLTIIVEDSCFDGPQTDSISLILTVLEDPGPDPDRNWKWAKTWGGTESDYAYSVAVDNSGNVYVTGSYEGTAEFNPDGGGEQTSRGYADSYLSKFDSNGNWQWTKTWGGTLGNRGNSAAADDTGNVYVTGSFNGTVEFNPDGGGDQTSLSGSDAYLSKFDSNGNWHWTETWTGGPNGSRGDEVAADNNGNIFVVGSYVNQLGAYMRKFDTDGTEHWAITWGYYSSDGQSSSRSVAVDNAGNVYVTGGFKGTVDFKPDGGGEKTAKTGSDAYLSKFDLDGNWQWTKTWGRATGYSVASDNNGNVYVTGTFSGTVEFNPEGGGEQTAMSMIYDAYLSKLDYDGNWQWTKTWGYYNLWWGYDGRSVAADNSGNVYVIGWFTGKCDFNPDGGGELHSKGSLAPYLSKFDSDGNWYWTERWGGDVGANISAKSVAADNLGNAYVAGFFSTSFENSVVEFNPDGGSAEVSKGAYDAYLTMFRDD